MAQDFFAEGIEDEQTVVFSKQQNQFLQAKLLFLDPRKTYQISMGNVLSLLKFAGLEPDAIKKIIVNSCKESSKTITYDEMKKIFRGVALKQKGIQPSKINIEANIKTKMPIFHDQDDSDQELQQQKPKPMQKPSIPTNQPVQKVVQKVQTQKPIQQPAQQPVQQPVQQAQQMDPMKAFDQYWKTLVTKNNKIDGSQVKKLCANNNTNKNSLSKVWKLCNISQKGMLTKGQFFVFINLVQNNNIPDSLTKQMKQVIIKIQQACGYKKSSTTSVSSHQVKTSSSSIPQKPKQQQMDKSEIFNKFGDESLFQKRPSVKAETSIINSSNVFANNNSNITPSANALLKKVQSISDQSRTQQSQMQQLSVSNDQASSILLAVEQYLSNIQQNLVQNQQYIGNLKQSQQTLNQRLNNVCLSMKDIITRQNQCINGLIVNINTNSNTNLQRLQILEKYTTQMSNIVNQTLQSAQDTVRLTYKNQTKAYNQTKQSNETLKQKVSANNYTMPQQVANQSHKSNGNKRFQNSQNTEQHVQSHVSIDHNPFDNQQPQNQPHQQHVPQVSSHHANVQSVGHVQSSGPALDIDSLSAEQKIKIKQMQLIQMVNYITPIKQEEYGGVVKRITEMTEDQMNTLYARLYDMYQKKQQEKVLEQEQQNKEFPNTDQFNTSQFIDQKTLRKHKNNHQDIAFNQ